MKYEGPTGINALSSEVAASINIFPDPSHGKFTLNVSYPEQEDAIVTITNMAGQTVQQFVALTNKEIPVQLHMAQGIYYVQALVKNKQVSSKIVVE